MTRFPTFRSRVEFLFALYENLTAPMVPASKAKRTRSRADIQPVNGSKTREEFRFKPREVLPPRLFYPPDE